MVTKFYKKKDIVENRYFKVPTYIDNVDFSNIPSRELIIQDGDRLDIIAEQIYNDPNYWREILLFNNLGYFFIPVGTVIRLPLDITKVTNRI